MEPPNKSHHKRGRFLSLGWAIAVAGVFIASEGFVFAHQTLIARQSGQLEATMARGPRVLVVPLSNDSDVRSIQLPASVHGYVETPVYAKVAGYLRSIPVDKGDHVRKGEVLAIIQSPETDKQVADALANYRLQLVTDRRYQYLLKNEVIAQQDADTQQALMLQAKATYGQELALQQYEIVRAPFDGIVSARYVDPGTLVPQSTTPSAGNPIIAMATLTPLRVYANVPQSLAPYVNNGDSATVTSNKFPGREFRGTVTRHPEALDPNTRTMLVEVDLPNPDESLLPGMYADIRITTYGTSGRIVVPDDAVLFRDNKTYLPLVRSKHLHLVEVTLGRDDGYRVEVSGEVQGGDLVAMNVGQAAHEGETVQPVRKPGA
ncbi:MAG: efflux RND transporter periplasmic adaptor subunit [Candidatus Binataceae bacterium]